MTETQKKLMRARAEKVMKEIMDLVRQDPQQEVISVVFTRGYTECVVQKEVKGIVTPVVERNPDGTRTVSLTINKG